MKISIITSTFNAAATLRHCFFSLAEQSVSCEHIVIDGGSTDGTLEIINEHCSRIGQFVSENDRGLYDALNKGIRLATGDVVGILHADDFYADAEVLSRIAEVFEDPSVEACYGDLLYVVESEIGRGRDREGEENTNSQPDSLAPSRFTIKRYWKSGSYDPRKFYWGWMPPHPTFFVRKSVYEKYGLFNLGLGTAADYELMLRLLVKQQISCKYIPEVLVKMRVGGVSNASLGNRVKANRMDRKAWDVNGLKPYPWTAALKPLRKISQWFRRPREVGR